MGRGSACNGCGGMERHFGAEKIGIGIAARNEARRIGLVRGARSVVEAEFEGVSGSRVQEWAAKRGDSLLFERFVFKSEGQRKGKEGIDAFVVRSDSRGEGCR